MNERQSKILAAINKLTESGKVEFTGAEVSVQIQKDSNQRYYNLSYGELYRILNSLIDTGVLKFRYHFDDNKKYYWLNKAGVK